jgi:hypothetical protein
MPQNLLWALDDAQKPASPRIEDRFKLLRWEDTYWTMANGFKDRVERRERCSCSHVVLIKRYQKVSM